MQIVDSSYGGASGLEHQSSHVDVLAPSYVGQRVPAVALRARDLPFVEREAAAAGGHVAIQLLSFAADALALGVRRNHRLLRRSGRGARRRHRREGLLRADGGKDQRGDERDARVARGRVAEHVGASRRRHGVHLLSEGLARRPDARHHDPRRERQHAFARRRDARPVRVDVQARSRLHADGMVERGVARRRAESRSRSFNARYIDGREPFPWDSILPARRAPRATGARSAARRARRSRTRTVSGRQRR